MAAAAAAVRLHGGIARRIARRIARTARKTSFHSASKVFSHQSAHFESPSSMWRAHGLKRTVANPETHIEAATSHRLYATAASCVPMSGQSCGVRQPKVASVCSCTHSMNAEASVQPADIPEREAGGCVRGIAPNCAELRAHPSSTG